MKIVAEHICDCQEWKFEELARLNPADSGQMEIRERSNEQLQWILMNKPIVQFKYCTRIVGETENQTKWIDND